MRPADEEALAVRCRKCKAKPGEMCVRLGDFTTPWHWSEEYQDTVQITYFKGEPCLVTHNERRFTVGERKRAAIRAAWQAQRAEKLAESRDVAAARAGWAFAANLEHRQMTAWLRAHGDVLWSS